MSNSPENVGSNFRKDDKIDLVEMLKTLWLGRKTLFKWTGIFFVIALIIIFGSPREYKSAITILVETNETTGNVGGLLKQFGGLAGINLGSGMPNDELSPELYPDIIQSTPFLLEIMNEKITDSKYDSTLHVSEFLDRHTKSGIGGFIFGYTFGLPGKILSLFRKRPGIETMKNQLDGPLKLTRKQTNIAKALMNRVKIDIGKSNNTFTISAEMQDPLLAATLVDSVLKTLTKYIIDYRTQKTKNDLQFVLKNQQDAEAKFIKAQKNLADFQDRNKNVILATAQVEGQNLQSEYNLAFSLYNMLSQQLEQAKMKLQDKTPVFKVIDPAKVPLDKDRPKTMLILIAMIFLGGFLGTGIILFKNFMFK